MKGVNNLLSIKKCNPSLVFLLVLISYNAPSANCSTASNNINKLEIMPNRNNDIHNLPINKRKFFFHTKFASQFVSCGYL